MRYDWQALLNASRRLREATDEDLNLAQGWKATFLEMPLGRLAEAGWSPDDMRVFGSVWSGAQVAWLAGTLLDSAGELADLGLTPVQVAEWMRLLYTDGDAQPSAFHDKATWYADELWKTEAVHGAAYVSAFLDAAGRDHASAVTAARAGVTPKEFAEYVTVTCGDVPTAALAVAAGLSQGETLAHTVNRPGDVAGLQALAGLRRRV